MPRTPQGQPHPLQRSVWVPIAGGAFVVVAFWVVYAAAAFFDKDLLTRSGPPGDVTRTVYLVIAALATALTVPIVLLAVKRTRDLVTRGVRTEARFVDIGGVGQHGMFPVTFAYSVGGRRFTVVETLSVEVIDLIDQRTPVGVLYDPLHPGRARVLTAELPKPPAQSLREAAADVARETFSDGVATAAFFALFIAQMALFIWIVKQYDLIPDDESRFYGPAALAGIGLAGAELFAFAHVTGYFNPRFTRMLRNLKLYIAAFLIGAIVWGGVAISSTRAAIASRREDEAQKAEYREMLRKAQPGIDAYRALSTRPTKRPATQPTTRRR